MMENMIEELKKVINFKSSTVTGDHVLIVSKEPQVAVYAVIDSIERDNSRKDEWWHVAMTLLTLPPQNVTWTLRENQFTGQEIFTMQGVEHFIQAVLLRPENDDGSAAKSRLTEKKKKDEKDNPFHIVK